ncbi:polymorphic toxin type 15 domain-containing protein [Microbacterium sp. P01]|uniref:polymorphic toxin type 15 domain-containing protein n=1 Tax=Microbacterium sp. P01 TaxID=3366261 RepID=UPI003672CEE6
MTDNPLVAESIDTATPFSGTGLLDDGTQLAHAIESGDWIEGGLAVFAGALDTVAAVSDPLGSLIAAGLGWLIDHFEPLKGWFNDLTGDAGEVAGFAQTWSNVSQALHASGDELTRILADVADLHGEAMDAYRRFQADAAQHIHGAGDWAGAMSTGLSIASTIVQVVHDLARDVISQLVGSAISWAAEAVFTLGLATPWIIEQVSTRVASLAGKVGTQVTKLLAACKRLATLLDELKTLLSKAGTLLESVLRRGGSAGRDLPVSAGRDLPGGTTLRDFELPTHLSPDAQRALDDMVNEVPPRLTRLENGDYQLADGVDVDSFTRQQPHHDMDEFNRQVELQRNGLNDLSVAEWRHNVEHYREHGRMGEDLQALERAERGGVPGDGQAVLHGPDQVAGGRPERFDGLGDAGINSSLGSQWKNRVNDLWDDVDESVADIPRDLWPYIRLNVHLGLDDVSG